MAEAKDRELQALMKKKTEEVEVMLRKQRVDKARIEVSRTTPRKAGRQAGAEAGRQCL